MMDGQQATRTEVKHTDTAGGNCPQHYFLRLTRKTNDKWL